MFSRLDEAVTGCADDCKQPDLGRSSKSIYYELIWDCLITSHQFLKNKVLFFEEKVSRGGGKRVWNSHIIIAGQSNFDSHIHQWSTLITLCPFAWGFKWTLTQQQQKTLRGSPGVPWVPRVVSVGCTSRCHHGIKDRNISFRRRRKEVVSKPHSGLKRGL